MVWIQDTKALVHLRIAYVGNGAIDNVDYIESQLTTEKPPRRVGDDPAGAMLSRRRHPLAVGTEGR